MQHNLTKKNSLHCRRCCQICHKFSKFGTRFFVLHKISNKNVLVVILVACVRILNLESEENTFYLNDVVVIIVLMCVNP